MMILDTAVFCWLSIWAWRALVRFRDGNGGAIDAVIVAHFGLFGVPLALDAFIGLPEYAGQPGLRMPAADPSTRILYALFVAACPLIWRFTGRGALRPLRLHPRPHDVDTLRRLRVTCVLLALLPLGLVALSPERSAYLTYASVVRGRLTDAGGDWHGLVASAALVSVLAVAILLSSYGRVGGAGWILALSSIATSCWIFGKRTLVAIALVALGYVLWSQGLLRGKRLYAAAVAGAAALLVYSSFYQGRVRFADDPALLGPTLDPYGGFRTDFFRDDRVKLAMFVELEPAATRILEFRGQSLLYDLTFFVPRSIWPDKPWPYAVYFTSATYDIVPPRPLGWGMTTSWLDEAIANFGWLGLLLGPLLLSGLCRIGDAFRWAPLNVLTILVVVLLLAVQLSAFLGLFLLWLLLVIFARLELRGRIAGGAEPAD